MLVSPTLTEARVFAKGLPSNLIDHLESVSREALALAERWDSDPEHTAVAAYLHDVARARKPDLLLEQSKQHALNVHPVEQAFPVLLHGPVGAAEVAARWPEAGQDFLAAINHHSTGRGQMTLLEKIVFMADKLDPRGQAPDPFFATLRGLAMEDLDAALLKFLDWQVQHLLERGSLVHPASIDARNALLIPGGRAGWGA